MSIAQDRTLWIRDMEETARGVLPDGTLVTVVNEYRHWGPFDKRLEEAGCPNPECRLQLYDRLTRIYIGSAEGHQVIAHINSGSDLGKLKELQSFEWNGRKVFIRDGRLELR